MDLILVTWIDAHSDAVNAWTSREDLDTSERIITSVGYLLDEVKHGYISLAQSIDPAGYVGAVLHIPWVCVCDKRIL